MSRYAVRFSSAARRALAETLPEAVAAAAYELITGALSENRQQAGKAAVRATVPLYCARRESYRVLYRIVEAEQRLDIVSITH